MSSTTICVLTQPHLAHRHHAGSSKAFEYIDQPGKPQSSWIAQRQDACTTQRKAFIFDNIYVSRAQTKVHINKNKYFYRILVTYESSHYVMSSNWQPRVQRWRQCRQQLLHQLCLRQHTCRVRTSVGKTQLRTKLAQFISVLSLELRLQPFPSLDSSFCLENLDELLNVTR